MDGRAQHRKGEFEFPSEFQGMGSPQATSNRQAGGSLQGKHRVWLENVGQRLLSLNQLPFRQFSLRLLATPEKARNRGLFHFSLKTGSVRRAPISFSPGLFSPNLRTWLPQSLGPNPLILLSGA